MGVNQSIVSNGYLERNSKRDLERIERDKERDKVCKYEFQRKGYEESIKRQRRYGYIS